MKLLYIYIYKNKDGNPSTICTRHFVANVNIPEENQTNKNSINPPPPPPPPPTKTTTTTNKKICSSSVVLHSQQQNPSHSRNNENKLMWLRSSTTKKRNNNNNKRSVSFRFLTNKTPHTPETTRTS